MKRPQMRIVCRGSHFIWAYKVQFLRGFWKFKWWADQPHILGLVPGFRTVSDAQYFVDTYRTVISTQTPSEAPALNQDG